MEVNSELEGFERNYMRPSLAIYHISSLGSFPHSSFLVPWHSDDSRNLGYY
jgi:hypothetical protein